jgi:hypothetical protein
LLLAHRRIVDVAEAAISRLLSEHAGGQCEGELDRIVSIAAGLEASAVLARA